MYLFKKHYVGNKYRDEKSKVRVTVPDNQTDVTFKTGVIKDERVREITEEVAYWRKANAVHKWFVENVQGGEDDCNDHEVSREQLQDLVDLCKTVLSTSILIDGKIQNGQRYENGEWVPILEDGKTVQDSTSAKILLPTASGFFFGGTDYDQYYVDDLKLTVEQISKVLAEGEDDGDFYYSASW